MVGDSPITEQQASTAAAASDARCSSHVQLRRTSTCTPTQALPVCNCNIRSAQHVSASWDILNPYATCGGSMCRNLAWHAANCTTLTVTCAWCTHAVTQPLRHISQAEGHWGTPCRYQRQRSMKGTTQVNNQLLHMALNCPALVSHSCTKERAAIAQLYAKPKQDNTCALSCDQSACEQDPKNHSEPSSWLSSLETQVVCHRPAQQQAHDDAPATHTATEGRLSHGHAPLTCDRAKLRMQRAWHTSKKGAAAGCSTLIRPPHHSKHTVPC